MTKQESIDYIHLRARECGYDEDVLKLVRSSLENLEEKDYDHLKRISEPVFRNWCGNLMNKAN